MYEEDYNHIRCIADLHGFSKCSEHKYFYKNRSVKNGPGTFGYGS